MIFDKGFMGFGDQERILLIRMVLLLLGMMVMYLVGVKDDIVGVAYRWKFVAQIFAGLIPPLFGFAFSRRRMAFVFVIRRKS